jgi:hypothetical protein
VAVSPVKVDPAILEAQRAEQQRLEEERRILAELPDLQLPFVGAWELEVRFHSHTQVYSRHPRIGANVQLDKFRVNYTQLENATLRAQAAARHAQAVLLDVEAEREHAMDRRRVAEEQLIRGQGGLAAVGLMGV